MLPFPECTGCPLHCFVQSRMPVLGSVSALQRKRRIGLTRSEHSQVWIQCTKWLLHWILSATLYKGNLTQCTKLCLKPQNLAFLIRFYSLLIQAKLFVESVGHGYRNWALVTSTDFSESLEIWMRLQPQCAIQTYSKETVPALKSLQCKLSTCLCA